MPKASLLLIVILFAALFSWMVLWVIRTRNRHQMELRSITPEALYDLINSNHKVLLFDVRQPLDLLAHSEIIPGAQRIDPREVLANPALIPREQDSVVYCTCPSDRTSKAIADRIWADRFFRVKFLRGGLAAWKAKGFPVEPYDKPFRLDTGS